MANSLRQRVLVQRLERILMVADAFLGLPDDDNEADTLADLNQHDAEDVRYGTGSWGHEGVPTLRALLG